MRFRGLWTAVIVLLLAVTACTDDSKQEPTPSPDATTGATETPVPLPTDWGYDAPIGGPISWNREALKDISGFDRVADEATFEHVNSDCVVSLSAGVVDTGPSDQRDQDLSEQYLAAAYNVTDAQLAEAVDVELASGTLPMPFRAVEVSEHEYYLARAVNSEALGVAVRCESGIALDAFDIIVSRLQVQGGG